MLTMNIYEISNNCDIYDSLYYVNQEDSEIVDRVLGYGIYADRPFNQEWKPIAVRIYPKQKRGDFIGLPGTLGCNKQAYKILEPLIKNSVELLPLNCKEGNYSLIKVTDIVDCLDYDNSTIDRFDDGRVMWVDSFAFYPEKIQNKHIFKIPELNAVYLVSQTFKNCVEIHGLEGLIFRLVWSSNTNFV